MDIRHRSFRCHSKLSQKHSDLRRTRSVVSWSFPTTGVAILVWFAICVGALVAPPFHNLHSGLAALLDKHNRLEKLKSPKLIIVGGSNCGLGIDSTILSKLLNRPVVNMG